MSRSSWIHILTDKKHYPWSRDAEANDIIHMGSDHRCVMAKFEIPKEKAKGKPRKTKAPTTEQQSDICDDEQQQKYQDLEQEVKEAEPGKNMKNAAGEATETRAVALRQEANADEDEGRAAPEASVASAAAADGKIIEKSHAAAPEGICGIGSARNE